MKRPDELDASLVCSLGTLDLFHGQAHYCCTGFTRGACKPDPTFPGCELPNVFGFSCQGSAIPSNTNSKLTCSVGITSGNGTTQYCCRV
jgi:hypothetical protein